MRFPGSRDTLVLTSLVALVFGVLWALVATPGLLAIGWAARRTRSRPLDAASVLALQAGMATMVLAKPVAQCLLATRYLPVWTLLVVIGVGSLLAVGVTWAVRHVLAQPRGLAVAGGLLVLSFAALLCAGPRATPDLGARTATPSGLASAKASASAPVVILGFDGLDPVLLKRLMDRGALPHFARFWARAATAEMQALQPTLSPPVWTTIATGKLPEKHGIHGFFTQRVRGVARPLRRLGADPCCGGGQTEWLFRRLYDLGLATPIPVTSGSRVGEALWGMLSRRGRSVAVVNWWASWPAERVRGVLVSDRFSYALQSPDTGQRRDLVSPPGAEIPLASHLVRQRDLTPAQIARFFDPTAQASAAVALRADGLFPAGSRSRAQREKLLLAFHAADLTYTSIAKAVLARRTHDLFAVYFRGVDVASHAFGGASELVREERPGAPRREAGRDARTLESYYRFADEQLGELLAVAPENAEVIVCSDHGFAWEWSGEWQFGHHVAAPPGVFAIAGPAVSMLRPPRAVRPQDVTPTVLFLLGEPVGQDMDGVPLVNLLQDDFVRSHPRREVPSYDQSAPSSTPAASADDAQIREELRALGYVE